MVVFVCTWASHGQTMGFPGQAVPPPRLQCLRRLWARDEWYSLPRWSSEDPGCPAVRSKRGLAESISIRGADIMGHPRLCFWGIDFLGNLFDVELVNKSKICQVFGRILGLRKVATIQINQRVKPESKHAWITFQPYNTHEISAVPKYCLTQIWTPTLRPDKKREPRSTLISRSYSNIFRYSNELTNDIPIFFQWYSPMIFTPLHPIAIWRHQPTIGLGFVTWSQRVTCLRWDLLLGRRRGHGNQGDPEFVDFRGRPELASVVCVWVYGLCNGLYNIYIYMIVYITHIYKS